MALWTFLPICKNHNISSITASLRTRTIYGSLIIIKVYMKRYARHKTYDLVKRMRPPPDVKLLRMRI